VRGRGDREIARLAAAQKGLVVREQLLAAGLARGSIAHRLAERRLHSVHPGVYLVGHERPSPLARELAAVLYLRGHGLLSHRTAAVVWGLADAEQDRITLTIVARDVRSGRGLRIFRAVQLDRRDVRVCAGLPLTSPARTLLDFAGQASPFELEQAVAEARVQGLAGAADLRAAIERAPRRKGVAALVRLLGREAEPALTRSEAERRLLGLTRDAQLPAPEVNARICGLQVDLLWRAERLVVEIDGHRFHGHRGAFEHDRKRDQMLVAAGYRVIRVTWRQLVDEPLAVGVRIGRALSAAAVAPAA